MQCVSTRAPSGTSVGAVRAERAVRRDVGGGVRLRCRERGRGAARLVRGQRAVDAVREVHRGGPGGARAAPPRPRTGRVGDRVRGQRHAERARRAERGRAPHREVDGSRRTSSADGGALDEAQPPGQRPLVDQPHPPPPPLDGRRDRVRGIRRPDQYR